MNSRLLLIILLIISIHCSSSKSPSTLEGSLDEGADPTGNIDSQVPIFPHADNWAEPEQHGLQTANQNLLEKCLVCHSASSSEDNIPACSSCHTLYPHPSEWIQKEHHGSFVLENGKQDCTSRCHGTDLQGGLSLVACTNCHNQYPHSTNWSNPEAHGVQAIGNKKELCQSCHGEDLKGGKSGVSCYQCHTNYPHSTNWSQSQNHGEFVVTNSTDRCTTACHGTDLKGGLSDNACSSCHNLYPHSENWTQTHGETTHQIGQASCQGCHGTDLKKLLNNQNCYSCHPDYPHRASNLFIPYSGGHGELVQETYQGQTQACTLCHGDQLNLIKNGSSCITCHASYPMNHQQNDWSNFEGHGQFTLEYGMESCKSCHGENLKGERSNPSCYQCHTTYPHPDQWAEPSEHGRSILDNDPSSCATQHCHGNQFLVEEGVTRGNSCFECHENYPHIQAGWLNGVQSTHINKYVDLVRAQRNNPALQTCTECHGENYDRLLDGNSCLSCHEDGTIDHQTSWIEASQHGSSFLQEATSIDFENSTCAICHGHPTSFSDSENTNGNCSQCHLPHQTVSSTQTQNNLIAQSDCYTCHWAYPHTSYTIESTNTLYPWGPSSAINATSDPHTTNYGHIIYLARSPLFIDANDEPASGSFYFNNPNALDALNHTCVGSTAGSCHDNGLRTQPYGFTPQLCSRVCHQPSE